MKKPLKFFVKIFFLAACWVLAGATVALASQEGLVKELREFRSSATSSDQCILVSPSHGGDHVLLRGKPKGTAEEVASVPDGTRCRWLESKELAPGEIWVRVQLPSAKSLKTSQKGWVPFDTVARVPGIRAFGKSMNVLVVFEAPCNQRPCLQRAVLVTPVEKRDMVTGTGGLTIDRKEENIFFSRIDKKEDENKRTYWESSLFTYSIPQNLLKRISFGISPKAHPKRDVVIFRNLNGQVFLADSSGGFIKLLYTPEQNVPLYRDQAGQMQLPPKKSLKAMNQAVVPQAVRLYRDPEEGLIPAPVEFLGNDKIRFEVLYDNGHVRQTVQLSLKPVLSTSKH